MHDSIKKYKILWKILIGSRIRCSPVYFTDGRSKYLLVPAGTSDIDCFDIFVDKENRCHYKGFRLIKILLNSIEQTITLPNKNIKTYFLRKKSYTRKFDVSQIPPIIIGVNAIQFTPFDKICIINLLQKNSKIKNKNINHHFDILAPITIYEDNLFFKCTAGFVFRYNLRTDDIFLLKNIDVLPNSNIIVKFDRMYFINKSLELRSMFWRDIDNGAHCELIDKNLTPTKFIGLSFYRNNLFYLKETIKLYNHTISQNDNKLIENIYVTPNQLKIKEAFLYPTVYINEGKQNISILLTPSNEDIFSIPVSQNIHKNYFTSHLSPEKDERLIAPDDAYFLPPAIFKSTCFLTRTDGKLFVLTLSDPINIIDVLDLGVKTFSPPLAVDGVVYLGAENGYLYAVGPSR